MLESLEAESNARRAVPDQAQMGLFERTHSEPAADQALRDLLDTIEPDGMSPREALETLYKLKALLDR